MYKPKESDSGILFTALSTYLKDLINDIPIIKEAMKYSKNYEQLLESHNKTIKRVNEILEEL